jgi:uncharacterized phage-associated protein
MPAPSAAAVANWFLEKAEDEGFPIDQLQLQKLVYYADGWFLANCNKELFSDDVMAWPHGPVIPSLWQQFRHFGRRPITERAREIVATGNRRSLLDATFRIPRLEDDDRIAVCQKVWEQYGRGRFSGVELSNMTHAKDEPWEAVRRHCAPDDRPAIPSSLIREAFARKLEAAQH